MGSASRVVRGNGEETIALYQSGGPPPADGSAPPKPTPTCAFTGPNGGKFVRPTWSQDGQTLAWQEGNGIWSSRIPDFSNCAALTSQLIVPGGTDPDFGPAAVNPGARPSCGNPGNPTVCKKEPPPPHLVSLGHRLGSLLASCAGALKRMAIHGLLRKHKLTLSFEAPGAGTLVLGLTTTGKHPVLVASARVVFRAGGKRNVVLTLTNKGRGALRHARSLRTPAEGHIHAPRRAGNSLNDRSDTVEMNTVAVISRLVLALVFAVAAAAKLADRGGTREAVIAFGGPTRGAGALAVALAIVELMTAGLLLPAGTAVAGAIAALALLAGFSILIAANLMRGRAPDCHCFGGGRLCRQGGTQAPRRRLPALGRGPRVAVDRYGGGGRQLDARLHGADPGPRPRSPGGPPTGARAARCVQRSARRRAHGAAHRLRRWARPDRAAHGCQANAEPDGTGERACPVRRTRPTQSDRALAPAGEALHPHDAAVCVRTTRGAGRRRLALATPARCSMPRPRGRSSRDAAAAST